MKLSLFLTLVLGLLWAPASWAVNGDQCDTDTGRLTRGIFKTTACVLVCDGHAAAASICAYDAGPTAGPADLQTYCWDFGNSLGVPDLLIFEMEDTEVGGACAGNVVMTILTSPEADIAPAYDLDSTAVVLTKGGTERIIIDLSTAPPDRYLIVNVTVDTSCTGVDLRMHMLVRSKQGS